MASRLQLVPGHGDHPQHGRERSRSAPLLGALLLSACTNAPPAPADACLDALPATCAAEVNPTYEEIFSKILEPRCGSSGTGCHGEQGRQANLGLYEIDEAYDSLLGHGAEARARVLPGDPRCSILMERLETSDTTRRMPRGAAQLSAGARCAIQQWIEAGAAR